jgi:hypothetical protein
MKNPNISRTPITAKTVPMLFLFKGYFRDNSVAIIRIINGNVAVINSAETVELLVEPKFFNVLMEYRLIFYCWLSLAITSFGA